MDDDARSVGSSKTSDSSILRAQEGQCKLAMNRVVIVWTEAGKGIDARSVGERHRPEGRDGDCAYWAIVNQFLAPSPKLV